VRKSWEQYKNKNAPKFCGEHHGKEECKEGKKICNKEVDKLNLDIKAGEDLYKLELS